MIDKYKYDIEVSRDYDALVYVVNLRRSDIDPEVLARFKAFPDGQNSFRFIRESSGERYFYNLPLEKGTERAKETLKELVEDFCIQDFQERLDRMNSD